MPLRASTSDFISEVRGALIDSGIVLEDRIVILDPRRAVTTDYDPETDTGGESAATLVLGPRPAYIKSLGAEVTADSGVLHTVLPFRIQLLPEPGDPLLVKGMVIRVLPREDGTGNPALPLYSFSVVGQTTGSIAVLTKVECQATGSPAPAWVAS
jgi:hypothetical protein